MRLTTRICSLGSAFLLAILILVLFGGLQNLRAAAESTRLTVDHILDQVEKKYADSKFSANFVQKSTIKAMDIQIWLQERFTSNTPA